MAEPTPHRTGFAFYLRECRRWGNLYNDDGQAGERRLVVPAP